MDITDSTGENTKKKNNRTAIIIDGPYLFKLKRNQNFSLDIFKFIKHLKEIYTNIVIKDIYYDCTPGNNNQNSFNTIMKRAKFRIIPVQLKIVNPGPSSESTYKSRTDQKITIEVMKYLNNDMFDNLILLSGDSDFEFLIDEIRQHNKQCEVWATSASISTELKGAANNYYLLDHEKFKHLILEK